MMPAMTRPTEARSKRSMKKHVLNPLVAESTTCRPSPSMDPPDPQWNKPEVILASITSIDKVLLIGINKVCKENFAV